MRRYILHSIFAVELYIGASASLKNLSCLSLAKLHGDVPI